MKHAATHLTIFFTACSWCCADDGVVDFLYPLAVAASEDVVYVADRNLPGIWKIEDGKKRVYFQASKKFRTPLNAVRCLAIDHEGHLLAGDSATRDVFRFDDQRRPVPLTNGKIGIPMAIVVAADGTIYVADLELHRICIIPENASNELDVVAMVNSPRGLALGTDNELWVLSTSSKKGQVQRVTPKREVVSFVNGRPFGLPHNIVRWDDGSLFVTDNYQHCVWKVAVDGKTEKWFAGKPLDRPVGLCRWRDKLLIADPHIKKLFQLDPMTKQLAEFESPPGNNATE